MSPIKLSKKEARRLAIHCQGLDQATAFGRGKQAVYRALDRLGYVQIDTISVVNRAQHHVLWSRVPNYTPKHLRSLQAREKSVFEHWSHAMSYLPMRDYRYVLPITQHFKDQKDRWPKSPDKIKKSVLERVREEGPMMARDFESAEKRKNTGWWDWKPAKLALERLFFEGELLIAERKGFQKVYDLPERVLPGDTDTSRPTDEEYARFLIYRFLDAHGVATVTEMGYQRKGIERAVIHHELRDLIENADIEVVEIKGLDQHTFYTRKEHLDNSSFRITKKVRLLSPFDNLVIQRKRTQALFDFDYQIECYVPKAKRKYGYFVLPILYGDTFIGRVDVKADRKAGELHLKNLVFEESFKGSERALESLADAVRAFADFHNSDKILVHRVEPGRFKEKLENLLSH